MRIALCHKRLDQKGGTERDFYLTACGLRDRGHEVHLFCGELAIDPPAGTFAHKVPVVPLGRTARLWSFAFYAPRIIGKVQCDVVVSFGRMIRQDVLRSGGGAHKIFLQRSREGASTRRVLGQRLSIYHRSLLALEQRQFASGNFNNAIAVSAGVKRELIDAYGVPENKILVLYNGVDPERFHPSLKDRCRMAVRSELRIPEAADLVLFVGNGFHRKGLDRLLSIWGSPELQNTFLVVVGDDARLGRYKLWAEREAPGRVIFAGRQEIVERFYGAADLLVLPARQEAFGNVVLEALASGVPAVVSAAVGAAELLTGPLAEGIVAHPDRPAELKAALLHMLQRSARPRHAVAARRLGEAHSWQNHFTKLEEFLAEVRERKASGPVSGFVRQKHGNDCIWIDPRLANQRLISVLRDPDALFQQPDCEIIKDQRKIKIGRLTLPVGGREKKVYVKRYNAFSWRYRLGSLVTPSRARTWLKGAEILAKANILTANPVAATETRRCGILDKSFFLSEEIENGKTADRYWVDDLAGLRGSEGRRRRESFMSALASLFRVLHDRNIYHCDLKDANIVVVPAPGEASESFFLLDLEGLRHYRRLSLRRREKNLAQLNRTMGNYLRRADKLRWLKFYLGPSSADRRRVRRWAKRVLARTRRMNAGRQNRSSRAPESERLV